MSDDVLLDELSVVVTSGYDLPARPERARRIRHLLLLVDPSDALASYYQATHRLLNLLDDALRQAPNDLLGADDRIGCRILLGVHPTYRGVLSPVQRRIEAAEYLVPDWHGVDLKDPAGTFQRRHQRSALRQILNCLRWAYGVEHEVETDYDVARVHRWYAVDDRRQVASYGERADYRIRRDGVTRLEFLESEPDAEGLTSAQLDVFTEPADSPLQLLSSDIDPTRPGFRRLIVQLARSYSVGEIVPIHWEETLSFGDTVADWGRYWATCSALNDGFELEMSVDFTGCPQRPDLCWWFGAEPMTDLSEIGPASLDRLVDLASDLVVTHTWTAAETERRRQYGFIWVWLDDEDARRRWTVARSKLSELE